jgi:hypothetical protein
MKKVYLSVLGFAMLCRTGYGQAKFASNYYKPATEVHARADTDTTNFQPRPLYVDEVDLVTSYYKQNGNHSAITGGIGTEKVTDISNGIILNMAWQNNQFKKNTLAVGLGFDYHTAASQAYVSATGASKTGGTRVYPSLDWTVENSQKGNSFGIGAYYSGEYNYHSLGTDIHWSQKTADRNGEFSAKLQAYFDNVTLIYPSELVPKSTTTTTSGTVIVTSASGTRYSSGSGGGGGEVSIPTSPRNTYTGSFSYLQQINPRLQVMFLGDVVTQNGYLSLPFHRVYFNTGKDTIEKLPSSRFKLPLGVRLNYFLGDNIIIRSYYRYYMDNWGIRSNTINLEIPVKINPFFSVSPFYRFYNQTAARYFAPYEAHRVTDQYYTSNYEYSKFNSNFFGVGFRIAPPTGVLGWQSLHDVDIRYGHYAQTTNLVSDVVSLNLSFK